MKEVKNKIIRVRLTQDEYQHLSTLSKQNNSTISEYLRLCLLEEPIPLASPSSAYDQKELMKLVVRMFCIIKEVGKDTLSPQKYQECNDLAEQVLKEWNYE